MMFTWIMGIAVMAFLIKMLMKQNKSKEPPGPKGLPIIGVAHKVDTTGLHKSVTQWSKEYGDVMKINMFGDGFVVLNSFEKIYDALVLRSEEFAGRPYVYRYNVVSQFCESIIASTFSPKWLAMKKLFMQKLKMYGPNLLRLEEISLDCIEPLLEELSAIAESGEAVNLKPILNRCITDILSSMLYGRKVGEDFAQKIRSSEEALNPLVGISATGLLLDKFPFLRYFPLNKLYSELVHCSLFVRKTIEGEIQKNKKTYLLSGEVNCLLDALLEHQNRNSDHKVEDKLSQDDIYILNSDMLGAGTVTTTLTLMALFATLVNKPEVQRRMFEEIKELIGYRKPCLQDRDSLPFTEAAILEILRYQTLLPLNLIHITTTDTGIGGYDLPKGTNILCNFWKVNHDPEFWENPWEFNPERFLDEDGNLLAIDHPRRKRLLAFGAGRRVCAGETLARSRIFLLVTSLLQHFEFLPESEDNHPSHDPRTYISGFTLNVLPYKVKLLVR